MHGVLKVLHGQLQIQTYTQFGANELVYNANQQEILAMKEDLKIMSSENTATILTPTECNYHEITAVDGVAAFFDILGPPYDADIPMFGPRKCRFYQTIDIENTRSKNNSDSVAESRKIKPLVVLQRIPSPMSYYCDSTEADENVIRSIFIHTQEAYSSLT